MLSKFTSLEILESSEIQNCDELAPDWEKKDKNPKISNHVNQKQHNEGKNALCSAFDNIYTSANSTTALWADLT